ncbi:MAG: NAD(P)H-dependent oxidoreductase [Bacteroidia bacterium]|nr:MAG: NAD(P)H-dependent oxidoreductase [Bacteroidia bacterium]
MEILDVLRWRYAIKQFDPTKRVSDMDFAKIKEAIQLSPSAIGLQPYEVMVIECPELRKALRPLCWDQAQIVEADRLLLFCHMLTLPEEYVNACAELASKERGNPEIGEQIKMITNLLLGAFPPEQLPAWTNAEVHIATGVAMVACAALGIDACPIAGFDHPKVDEHLGLKARNLGASLFLPIGYRSPEDVYSKMPKVRKPMELLFTEPKC